MVVKEDCCVFPNMQESFVYISWKIQKIDHFKMYKGVVLKESEKKSELMKPDVKMSWLLVDLCS